MFRDDRSITYFVYLFYLLTIIGLALILAPNSNAQPLNIQDEIRHSAECHGINPALALAIAEVESGLNPNALGQNGEVGLFQLNPRFHSVVRGETVSNIDAAMKYLTELKKSCGLMSEAWFVCFNYGPNRILKSPRSTLYYRKVMAALHKYYSHTEGWVVCSGK